MKINTSLLLAHLLCVSFVFTGFAFNAQATILTFDIFHHPGGAALSNGILLPVAYGNRVTESPMTVGDFTFEYEEGTGWTPNIEIEYIGTDSVFFWNSGYGDLNKVVYANPSVSVGQVILSPDPGYDVVLNSLDYAAWGGDRTGTLRIYNIDGTVFHEETTTWPASNTHLVYDAPIISSSPLTIEWGAGVVEDTAYYLAVDNVNFDQRMRGSQDRKSVV